MSIDLWTLGLQAVNVAILIWLLSRIFWKPIAEAIAARQAATEAMLDAAAATQAQADAALAKVAAARAGIAAERATVLAEAQAQAEVAAKETLAAARTQATAMRDAAAATAVADAAVARKDAEAASARLAVEIARKLLAGLDTQTVQAAFLTRLVAAIAALSPQDRAMLLAAGGGVELVSSADLDAASRNAVTAAVHKALGGQPALHFVTDRGLIAGKELRTPHFTLHNSWRADLDDIKRALTDVA